MAKLIIVCVIAMLAVASAAFTFQDAMNGDASMQVEAMTCPTITCLGSQGQDCASTSTDVRVCMLNEYENTTSTGSCNCRSISQFIPVGTQCYPGATTQDQCGPYAVCTVAAGGAIADFKCYGLKMVGDSCTTGSYECLAPRTCVAGVCAANLAAGATCFNATTPSVLLGVCPMNQYCPQVYTSNQVCTPLATAGSACSSVIKCVPFTQCGLLTPADPKCDRKVYGAIAAGTQSTYLGAASCASYLVNTSTTFPYTCVDYDTELAKWNAAFPTPALISCSDYRDCNLAGVRLAECVCTNKATGATPYCLLSQKPSIAQAGNVANWKQGGIFETAYEATCENPRPFGAQFVKDAAYCSSKWSSQLLAAICPTISYGSNFYSCYDDSLGLCNGASALQSSVVMTMIVALVAFFTTQ
jgi:hypothetical protein